MMITFTLISMATIAGGVIGGFVALNKRITRLENLRTERPTETTAVDFSWAQTRRQAVRAPQRTAEMAIHCTPVTAPGEDLWLDF